MDLTIPAVIQAAIDRGAAVAISVSAGKDSQAMERALSSLHEKNNWPGPFFAIHADIGPEFDWAWTVALCERNAKALGHPLYVVRRENGETLLQTIQKRVATCGSDKPGFPSHAVIAPDQPKQIPSTSFCGAPATWLSTSWACARMSLEYGPSAQKSAFEKA